MSVRFFDPGPYVAAPRCGGVRPMTQSSTTPAEFAEFKRALLTLGSAAACRRAGALAASASPSSLGLAPHDASAVLEIAACIARDGTDAELTSFLRTGRLPELLALSPRQMEQVRGGRMNLTASRGIAPEVVLACWRERAARETA